MNLEFHSKEELFLRVEPALKTKLSEMEKLGYTGISNIDIWNFLIHSKWKHGFQLMLSDIVDDILNTNNQEIVSYLSDYSNKEG